MYSLPRSEVLHSQMLKSAIKRKKKQEFRIIFGIYFDPYLWKILRINVFIVFFRYQSYQQKLHNDYSLFFFYNYRSDDFVHYLYDNRTFYRTQIIFILVFGFLESLMILELLVYLGFRPKCQALEPNNYSTPDLNCQHYNYCFQA